MREEVNQWLKQCGGAATKNPITETEFYSTVDLLISFVAEY
jgi:hypothetical protein